MKKYLISSAIMGISFLVALSSFAQKDSSGIYKTANDFVAKKLSLAVNCKTETHKIKINAVFNQDHFTVVHDGKSYEFKKSDVYGYKLCNGETYRFSGNNDYLVMNPNEMILLYRVEIPQPKAVSPKKYTYYFSKDALPPCRTLQKKT